MAPTASKKTDSDPPASPSLIVGTLKLGRTALLQGHFERALIIANQLQYLSLSFNEPSAQSMALAIQGVVALMIENNTQQGKTLCMLAQALGYSADAEDLIQWGLAIASLDEEAILPARTYFARVLKLPNARLFSTGCVNLAIHALFEIRQSHFESALQALSLSWAYAMPDGGWLQHSPRLQQAIRACQQIVGDSVYRQQWNSGRELPFHYMLQEIAKAYA